MATSQDGRWKPNVTVAAIASRQRDGRAEYLLVEEETSDGLRLNNPAGHLEPDESPAAAAVREAFEETGCRFEPTHLVGVYLLDPADESGATTYLRFAYAGTVGEPVRGRPLDPPVVRTLWLTLAELRDCRERHRSALVLRCIEDDAAGRSYPLDAITHVAPDRFA